MLRQLDNPSGPAYFEPTIPDGTEHQHHLVCRRCRSVIQFEDDAPERALDSLAERLEHDVTDHEVVRSGLCRACHDRPDK